MLGLYPYGFGVGTQRRHAHAGGAHLDVGVHDLARLVVHLHLLFGISVVGEYIDMGDDVVSQLVRKFLDGNGFAAEHLAILCLQFRHSLCACAGGCLVGRYVYAAYMTHALQGLQSHYHLDSGAVGVGDDVARTTERVLGIDLGHYQRHILVHAESGGIVNQYSTKAGDVVRVFA